MKYTKSEAKTKLKRGQEVVLKGVIIQVDYSDNAYPYRIDLGDIKEWLTENEVSLVTMNKSENKESIDHINPAHYKKFSYEVIEMMEAIWGKEHTAIHCEMCAFKYRLRMGEKPDQPIESDLGKVKWYLDKAAELRK